jgi:hypothetical protein
MVKFFKPPPHHGYAYGSTVPPGSWYLIEIFGQEIFLAQVTARKLRKPNAVSFEEGTPTVP